MTSENGQPSIIEELRRLAEQQGIDLPDDAPLQDVLAALDPSRDLPGDVRDALFDALERLRRGMG
jgi:hypothetical protein